HGDRTVNLKEIGQAARNDTGTTIHFWPAPNYFDSPKFHVPRLKHTLRAKAVLCPGLQVTFTDLQTGESESWHYEDGLKSYLIESLQKQEFIPADPFIGHFTAATEEVDWAAVWLPETSSEGITESYVNLIPTSQGGTHVNGLRTGLLEAMREFCELRN